jgi:hypothetical protein
VRGSNPPGEEREEADAGVPGEFVDASREATPVGGHQVDHHVHRHRPGERLIDAQQHVRSDHPRPRWRPDQQQRHRQPEQPADPEHLPAPDAVGPGASEQVGDGFGDPEADDERGECTADLQPEGVAPEEWNHGTLEPHHPTDEHVDGR